jgi:antitoxin HigA-1
MFRGCLTDAEHWRNRRHVAASKSNAPGVTFGLLPMKNPVHRGALAQANLDELNLSVAEAAKTMKITRQQLHNVMQGRSADMWLRMQDAYDLAYARKHQGDMNIPRLVEHPSA